MDTAVPLYSLLRVRFHRVYFTKAVFQVKNSPSYLKPFVFLAVLSQNKIDMRKYSALAIVALLVTTLSSCELVEGIFKAGVWTGVIIVVIVLVLIIWLISKIFGGKG